MASLSGLLFGALTVVMLFSVSTTNVVYNVTFLLCAPSSTCPQGNPSNYNRTFALNGTLSPNLTLKVGDRLEFDLAQNVPSHPLTICQNSTIPQFCYGASNSSQLSTPITAAGNITSATFTSVGTYYYGCLNHPGMGATITVQATGHQLSASFLSIALIILLKIIFI